MASRIWVSCSLHTNVCICQTEVNMADVSERTLQVAVVVSFAAGFLAGWQANRMRRKFLDWRKKRLQDKLSETQKKIDLAWMIWGCLVWMNAGLLWCWILNVLHLCVCHRGDETSRLPICVLHSLHFPNTPFYIKTMWSLLNSVESDIWDTHVEVVGALASVVSSPDMSPSLSISYPVK